jgi:hypothetical protein
MVKYLIDLVTKVPNFLTACKILHTITQKNKGNVLFRDRDWFGHNMPIGFVGT